MPEKKFKKYALVMITTILLSLFSVFLPGFSGLLVTAILSAVIGYAVTKFHYHFVSLLCVCTITVAALFSWDLMVAVSYMLPAVLCGISLGIAYNVKLTEAKTISVISCIYTFYLVANISIMGTNSKGQNIIEEALLASSETYQQVLTTAYGNQFPTEEINRMVSTMLTMVTKFIPTFIIIACISIAFLHFAVFKQTLKITNCDTTIYKKPFSAWHADKTLSVVFLIITVISFVAPAQDYLGDVLANAVAVSCFVFFIFGLAYVNFLLMRLMRNSALRRIILVFIAVSSLFAMGLPFIALLTMGVLDGFVDFRRKSTKNNLPE